MPPNTPLTISLHGFPALRSRQNRVIAERLAETLQRRVEAPLYAGLGVAPGVFRFRECLEEVRAYVSQRLVQVPTSARDLDFVGHSWGGYISLALLRTEAIAKRVRRLVLMSPLLQFGTAVQVRDSLMARVAESVEVNLGDIDELARDFEWLGLHQPSAQLLRSMPREIDVLVLQAAEDEVTPAKVATAMLKYFPRPPRFELVANDHGFSRDRLAVADQIAEFLR